MDQRNESQGLIASLSKNYRILPLYEKSIADHQLMKHASLQQNKYFACKWKERKDNIGKKKKIPFEFPHASDYHFYNYDNCYKPSESINKRTDFRYTLVVGPGVDDHGVIPLPNDLCVRSTSAKPNRKSAVLIKRKTKKRKLI